MSSNFTKTVSFLCLILISNVGQAQTKQLVGFLTDSRTQHPIEGASIKIKGKPLITESDKNGKFVISWEQQKLPAVLQLIRIGYLKREVTVRSTHTLQIQLEEVPILGQEVVVSASRSPEPMMKSPVSIERINGASLKNAPATSFYDGLINLKGVEMSTQSLTFKSVNTRGFNSDGNFRFNQFVDGMDNMAPGLNFPVGNIIGLSDLDLDYAELLPGASSALYGAGGTNGTLVMNSKDPFNYPGVSFQFKQGITQVGSGSSSTRPFSSADLRIAKSWHNKFGFKIAYSFLEADDWIAANSSNYDRAGHSVTPGDNTTDPNYDGVNVYGDEVSRNMINVAQSVLSFGQSQFIKQYGEATGGLVPSPQQIDAFLSSNQQTAPFFKGLKTPGLIPNQSISRTGYAEEDLVEYKARNFKTSSALYYKFDNGVKAVAQANWGKGTTMYTGSDRYSLRNFSIGQYKLELSSSDFFIRAYTTQERSGDSYVTSILASYINEQAKASTQWFPEYIANYIAAKSNAEITEAQAHNIARAAADKGRLAPGTADFNTTRDQVLGQTISSGKGASFDDRSNLYHYEGMYKFNNLLRDLFELQVGISSRKYQLRSAGTIFDDLNRKLDIDEFGTYLILGKKLLQERLKITFAGRYDKNNNFEGRFSPRVTGVYSVSANHHIRASYQTGFRNPTTQYQYLDLSAGGGSVRLIGGLPEMLNKYQLLNNKPYTSASYGNYLNSLAIGNPDQALLKTVDFNPRGILAETVHAFELGDKMLVGENLFVDGSVYYNTYQNFISEIEVYQLNGDQVTGYSVPVNTAGTVTGYGSAVGFDYIIDQLHITGNFSYNNIAKLPSGYANDYGFNTPKFRCNLGLANPNIWGNFGFSTVYRWQNSFHWSTPFVAGKIPAYGVLDGQINYTFPAFATTVKIGGSNLLNKRYHSAFGNPLVGALYYVSLGYNL
jgi:outer membrane receptor protein involved in Fe transport